MLLESGTVILGCARTSDDVKQMVMSLYNNPVLAQWLFSLLVDL